MCGISGIYSLSSSAIQNGSRKVHVMNDLIEHRGPDGEGYWSNTKGSVHFGHRRLSIIDLEGGAQPIHAPSGDVIIFNGELYNYKEIRKTLDSYPFKTDSDSEVVLAAYEKWGADCLKQFRGMFSFLIWNEREQKLFGARDPFGVKPFYYVTIGDSVYFGSEVKQFLPFLPEVAADEEAVQDYLVFQFYLNHRTLFKNVKELPAGHMIQINGANISVTKYWEVYYDINYDYTRGYFLRRTRELLEESIQLQVRSDVPIGAYISGGIDSSAVASLARQNVGSDMLGFVGKFSSEGNLFDETEYARSVAKNAGIQLYERDIKIDDFINNIEKVSYHMDYPVAGPGSFAQYCVSELAAQHRKVVLGGQGGDEIFGGYTRYLIAYFEQCIHGAINGSLHNGNFVVTYESIIGNLKSLQNYKPMLKKFFSAGLFDPMDQRYFHLINRSPNLGDEIRWDELTHYNPFESFQNVFNAQNVGQESYFDKMTHFDFKTLLPALLQVEDRMSMAFSLESRVPILDPKLVELAATIPADIKFKDGTLKMLWVDSVKNLLPKDVVERKDKMGFPVPLNQWLKGPLREFIYDIFSAQSAQTRRYYSADKILAAIDGESQFGRKIWGLLSLELWHRNFVDKHHEFKKLVDN